MRYVGYPDERKDEILLRKESFKIDSKFDPLSITVFWVQPRNGQIYLVLNGKSQSASGSGNQVTYFWMVQLRKDSSIEKHFEFQSRFGTMNNIIDYNNDGEPDYFKIENSNKLGKYRLTIHHLLDNVKEASQLLLSKKSNDVEDEQSGSSRGGYAAKH